MKLRKIKELQTDMRDTNATYPRRGVSLEEVAVINLMDVIFHFNSIKQSIKSSIPCADKDSHDKLDYFENRMHEKFDIVESLLKECNIEQWENYNKNLENKD